MNEPPLVDGAVLSRLEGDVGPRIVARTIELFLEQAPRRLEEVRAGVREADLDATAEALHSIKSSAAMLGAIRMSEVAGRAERLAREGHAAEVASLVGGFEATFEQTTEVLRARRRELVKPTPPTD